MEGLLLFFFLHFLIKWVFPPLSNNTVNGHSNNQQQELQVKP